MSELPISSKYRSTPDKPVSEDERNQLTQRLNEAFEAGQLQQDDYSTRLDRLYAAQQLGELVPVVDGLPSLQSYNEPEAVKQASGTAPGELEEAKDGRSMSFWVIAAIVVIAILVVILLAIVL